MFKSAVAYFHKTGNLFLLLSLALVINHRTGYITLIGLFSVLTFFSVMVRRKIDVMGILLGIYCVVYLFMSIMNGIRFDVSTLVLYGVAPVVFYEYGRYIPQKCNREKELLLFWLIIISCYCIDIFIGTINTIVTTGEIINVARKFSFSQDGKGVLSATLVGLCMDIGMIGLPMLILIKQKGLRIGFLLIFLMSLLTTIHLLNRTGLIVMGICFLGIIGYYSRNNLKVLIMSLFFVIVLLFILIYIGVINTELINLYNERNVDLSTMGSRTERWQIAIENLFISPLGWANNGNVYYIHNMWLDVARNSGILPFVLLVYFTIHSFKSVFNLLMKNENILAYMLLGLNICFFTSCFVEPVYGGTHMNLYCMLWGMQNALIKNIYIYQ